MDDIHPLKAYRQERIPPLSQQQLAGELSVSRETVARWETGRDIDIGLVPRVSGKTGIPPGKLRPDLAAIFAQPEAAE
jgi:transcriptional regulator with XRE-family HTH domain